MGYRSSSRELPKRATPVTSATAPSSLEGTVTTAQHESPPIRSRTHIIGTTVEDDALYCTTLDSSRAQAESLASERPRHRRVSTKARAHLEVGLRRSSRLRANSQLHVVAVEHSKPARAVLEAPPAVPCAV